MAFRWKGINCKCSCGRECEATCIVAKDVAPEECARTLASIRDWTNDAIVAIPPVEFFNMSDPGTSKIKGTVKVGFSCYQDSIRKYTERVENLDVAVGDAEPSGAEPLEETSGALPAGSAFANYSELPPAGAIFSNTTTFLRCAAYPTERTTYQNGRLVQTYSNADKMPRLAYRRLSFPATATASARIVWERENGVAPEVASGVFESENSPNQLLAPLRRVLPGSFWTFSGRETQNAEMESTFRYSKGTQFLGHGSISAAVEMRFRRVFLYDSTFCNQYACHYETDVPCSGYARTSSLFSSREQKTIVGIRLGIGVSCSLCGSIFVAPNPENAELLVESSLSESSGSVSARVTFPVPANPEVALSCGVSSAIFVFSDGTTGCGVWGATYSLVVSENAYEFSSTSDEGETRISFTIAKENLSHIGDRYVPELNDCETTYVPADVCVVHITGAINEYRRRNETNGEYWVEMNECPIQ